MKLLVLQETDWLKRGPHQQHHLMDRMALRGHNFPDIKKGCKDHAAGMGTGGLDINENSPVEEALLRLKLLKAGKPTSVGGDVFDQLIETEKFVFNNIALSAWIEDEKIQRQERWEYPQEL